MVITIVNTGHNLYKFSPKVTEAIERFMRDEEIMINEIEISLLLGLECTPTPLSQCAIDTKECAASVSSCCINCGCFLVG
jgi:hypothetical protein